MVMTVFGNYPKSVSAFNVNNCINVIFHYDNFNVNGIYSSDNFYQAGRFVKNESKIEKLEVKGYPTIILFKDGVEVKRLAGLQQKPALIKALEELF